jgi:CHAT domain-containing protein/Tfp pilus assembly protein PilF
LKAALADVDAGFRREPSWRFRLLKAEILLASSKAKAALDLLESSAPPASAEQRARLRMHQAWAKFLLGDFPGAETAMAEAQALAEQVDAPRLHVEIELRRGPLLLRLGKNAEAEESFRAALSGAAALGDLYLQTNTLGNLGVMFLSTHRPEEAVYWLERALDASRRLGSPVSIAKAQGNLGSCYFRLGDYDKALSYLGEAEAGVGRIGDSYQRQIWIGNIGNVLLDRGEFARAVESYKRALAIARDIGDPYWTAWWEYNLANAAIQLGDLDEAERHNNEALRLKQSIEVPDSYPLVKQADIAAARKNFALAEKLYRAVLVETSDDPIPKLDAESGLARLLITTGQFELADAQFRSGIDLVERRRAGLTRDEYKLSYLSSLIEFYQRYVDFLVTRGETAKALEVAESSRARLLDERLRPSAATRTAVTVPALEQLARSSHAILLSYWLAPDRSFLWAVTPDGVTLHRLPSEKQIVPLVESYRSFIESLRDPLDSEFPAGRKLSEMLLGPVLPLLSRNTRIIVVPDRALHSLNFETLPDPQDASHYLIDRATVAVAPSLGVLAVAHGAERAERAERSLLLIGNPVPAVEEYPKLPYAEREMTLIARNFAPGRYLRIEGAQAYPAAYREAAPARFSWIHFAAHASANRENPLDSALILSRHDGVYALPAREVMNVAVNADLVTLSACRSAGAKTYSGEGLVGLSWAFLRAGAKSVVAGLWDVTDMSTASLMADFYSQMTKNVRPADALRAAKLGLIRSKGAYRKPFYWGPFELYVGAGL